MSADEKKDYERLLANARRSLCDLRLSISHDGRETVAFLEEQMAIQDGSGLNEYVEAYDAVLGATRAASVMLAASQHSLAGMRPPSR